MILEAAFDGAIPPLIDALVDRALCRALLEDFKLGVILPLGAARPVRVAVSDQGERERWERLVYPLDPSFPAFLDYAGRRFLDTDGTTHVPYLDDLPAPLLCRTPGTVMNRHDRRPAVPGLELLPETGLFGIRRRGDRVVGVLWVTESRWKGDADRTRAIAAAIGTHPTLDALNALGAYPDALELREDGSWDLTLGFLGTLRV